MKKCENEAKRLSIIRMKLARRERQQGLERQEDGSFFHDYESTDFDDDALAAEYRSALDAFKKCKAGKDGGDDDDGDDDGPTPIRTMKKKILER